MGIALSQACLRDIAAELRRRAKRTCSRCGGFGHVCPPGHMSYTAANAATCPRCQGTGYEPWPELLALAEQLEGLERGR
ncbi:MAG: hypothetical protein H8D78_08625 [Chloroflexi bacterium]|nr:hypothetical protein [Chloroflexota bacterium]